jgi:hypothetical protein
MGSVAIVIVTYNSAGYIGRCLDAALPRLQPGDEIVVVDNASEDGSVDEVRARGVRLIENRENRGFAAAVNQGVQDTATDLILLLNPDALLTTGLDPLRAASQKPGTAGAGGCLAGPDGLPQRGFTLRRLPTPAALALEALLLNRLWPSNPVNWHYRCYDLDLTAAAGNVEQPAGALLMVRRRVWEELGGLDQSFFPLWFEDVDFCKRARDQGYYWAYTPGVVAVHDGGHSLRKISLDRRQVYWYGSLLKYASKHFTRLAQRGVCSCILLGSVPRMVAGMFAQRSFKPIAAFGGVIRLAARHLVFGR